MSLRTCADSVAPDRPKRQRSLIWELHCLLYHRLISRQFSSQIKLHGCAGWSGATLAAYIQRPLFAWHGSFVALHQKKRFQSYADSKALDQSVHTCSLNSISTDRTWFNGGAMLHCRKCSTWPDCTDAQTDLKLHCFTYDGSLLFLQCAFAVVTEIT